MCSLSGRRANTISDSIQKEMQGKELPNPQGDGGLREYDMGAAYHAADLVVSRAGASSISEFQLIGKPVILVPSPTWRRTTSARMPWPRP